MEGPTSGTGLLDTLIDGVHIGDNLVLQGAPDTPLDLLVDRFVTASRGHFPVVWVTLTASAPPVDDGITVLDWSAVRTGRPTTSTTPYALAPEAGLDAALAQLHLVDEAVGTGAAFVFDRLTAVQAAWGEAAALTLFLTACPRLYRRESLALWPVEADQHPPSFLRRLAEITQVVVELSHEEPATDDGELTLTVRKADGRDPGVIGRQVHARVEDHDLVGLDPPVQARQRLGTLIREQRLARGLSQAQVARDVSISPSALSQIERGVRGPSGDTLVRLWEVLEVPFGPAAEPDRGYRVARRSGRDRQRLQEGLVAELLVDDDTAGQLWRLEAAAGARGDAAPFTVKVAEVVTVVRGVLDLRLGGHTETLHEGDALVTTTTPVTGWGNPSDATTEVLWHLQPTRR